MEQAIAFRELLELQERRVRELDRYPDPALLRDLSLFRRIAGTERHIHRNILELRDRLRELADALPEEYAELSRSARAFAHGIDGLQIPSILEQAAEGGENQDGRAMTDHARLALERMHELLDDCAGTGFGQMCRGQMPSGVSRDAAGTLQQMMQAWYPGRGQGDGGIGAGGSGGGFSESGFAMGGYSALNVPLIGPERLRMGPPGAGAGDDADFRGAWDPAAAVVDGREGDGPGPLQPPPPDPHAPQVDRMPEQYRDALQRYFSNQPPEAATP